MTPRALTDILTKQALATVRGSRAEVPTSAELTLFAACADEALLVERVRAIDLEAEYLVAHTAKEDRYVLLYEDVRALRVAGKGGPGAGYAG